MPSLTDAWDELLEWPQSDGFGLRVHHRRAVGAARAAVLILHGLAEHGARYAPTARALCARGLATYAPDHRGHGQSAASPSDLGFWAQQDGFERVVADVAGACAEVARRHPGLPIVLLGHSAGSFLALAHAERRPTSIAALALSGTGGPVGLKGRAGRLVARIERRRHGPRGRSELLDRLSFGGFNAAFAPCRTPFDWLSRDERAVDCYLADPLCGFISSTQLWVDLLGGLLLIHQPEQLRRIPANLPIRVFSGARDPVGEDTLGVRRLLVRMRASGLARVTHQFYPGARHEVLHEINRAEVRRDLIAWIEAALRA